MPRSPNIRASTVIDCADTPLGDGSSFVLPGKTRILPVPEQH
jgi:hypothetical protein